MIHYALVCPDGHEFEGWFSGSEAFEAQRGKGLLACPVCGSTDVDRALMAPAVSTARRREGRGNPEPPPQSGDSNDSSGGKDAVRLAANVPERQEVVKALRKLRRHLTDNADYVGPKFAEEARRIHYDEVEKRAIYGEATREDATALAEEGIDFHPLPPLPEDKN